MTLHRRAAMGLPLLALARCAAPPPPPAALELIVTCAAAQNPDTAGRPAPVAVKLFFLTASAKFERADVFALTEREKATLGEDSMGSEEFVVRPGETRTLERKPKPGVQFIGAAVLFRDIDRATWRAVAPIAASGLTKLKLDIAGISVKLGAA